MIYSDSIHVVVKFKTAAETPCHPCGCLSSCRYLRVVPVYRDPVFQDATAAAAIFSTAFLWPHFWRSLRACTSSLNKLV
jgi:hypothetical protein